MSKKDRNLQEQELTPREKKVIGIIGGVCALLMILVIVISIINAQDNKTIASKYDIPADNVFEYIDLDKVKERKADSDSFHVVILKSNASKVSTFLEIVNNNAKELGIKKVYILEIDGYSKSDLRDLASTINEKYDDAFGSSSKFLPSLVYFSENDANEKSGLGNYDNYSSAVKQYFINCGYTFNEE